MMATPPSPSPLEHLYNTSFHLHRLTPLHVEAAQPLTNPAILRRHTIRLANLVRGDVLRGVRVADGGSDESGKKDGGLEKVDLTEITLGGDESGINGVAVVFTYAKSKTTYSAFLLRRNLPSPATSVQTSSRRSSVRVAASTQNLNYYPLLLTRMPAALTATFLNYLATSFDCKVSTLALSDRLAVRSLDAYLQQYIPRVENVVDIVPEKDVQIVLEPPPIPTATTTTAGADEAKRLTTLKTISLSILKNDVVGFLHRGQKLQNATQGSLESRGPFELALSLYLLETMGVVLDKLRMQKIACGAFVFSLASDGGGRCSFADNKDEVQGERQDGQQEQDEEAVRRRVPGILVDLVKHATGAF